MPSEVMHLPRRGRIAGLLLSGLLLAVCGCAGRSPMPPSTTVPSAAATRPSIDPKAMLSLDQIQPPLTLPAAAPTTRAARRPPLEALELYAQARDAFLDRHRDTAVDLLQKALALDPDSFDLHYALAQALINPTGAADQAIAELQTAVQLRPDHLRARVLLGRLCLLKGNLPQALEHLRLAIQTSDYRREDEFNGIVDFYLARALQQAGYDRAALDCYQRLLDRLRHPGMAMYGNAELIYLANRPEIIHLQLGQLHERLGDFAAALDDYTFVAGRDPDNFDFQSRVVRTLLSLQRQEPAKRLAAECVTRFRASADSLDLLREVYRRLGQVGAIADELAALHARRPDDRAILFALADALHSQGRRDEAEKLLAGAVVSSNAEFEIVHRLFKLYISRAAVEDAAVLLIDATARRPAALQKVLPLWADLIRPSQKKRLTLSTLQKLVVPPRALAAKHFWVSRLADLWNRDALSRTSLEQAVRLDPPLAPAYRLLLGQYWSRPDWDDAQKIQASRALAQQADQHGDPALAAELRGLTLLNQRQPDSAIESFTQAMKLGNQSPDLQFIHASALLAQNKDSLAEQMLWKIIADSPGYEDAYAGLFRYYLQRRSGPQAFKVLSTWLSADPDSINARILEANVYLQLKRGDAAEAILLSLFKNNSDKPEVLAALESFYTRAGRIERCIAILEEERQRHPDNHDITERLVNIYASRSRLAEASRALDALRLAAAADPDLLYSIAHLYTRINRKQTTEAVLQQVLTLDATHAGASNDLGYGWADEGRNLQQAETLIRTAVQIEPDNQSFLDSLGWVLYKRGRFEEARRYLQQALGSAARPDPLVLDHMGDVLYKLGRTAEADKVWQRSLDRLNAGDDERDDLKQLRLQLLQKIKMSGRQQPVQVAPIAEPVASPTQAKN